VLLAEHVHELPPAMLAPLYVLAVPTVIIGLVMIRPPAVLDGLHIDLVTGVTGAMLSLAGLGWALSAPRLGAPDIAVVLPDDARGLLRDGYRLDAVQQALVVRPVLALARVVRGGDRDVVDAYVRGIGHLATGCGALLRRAQTGLATAYTAWVMVGAVIVALAGVALS
jgi:NADH-quinone oxidoreductase subunit L